MIDSDAEKSTAGGGRFWPAFWFFVLLVLSLTFVMLLLYSIDEAYAQSCGPQIRFDEYGRSYRFFIPCERRMAPGGMIPYGVPYPEPRRPVPERPLRYYPPGYPYFGIPRDVPNCYLDAFAPGCGP